MVNVYQVWKMLINQRELNKGITQANAIGIALIATKTRQKSTNFKGSNIYDIKFKTSLFTCNFCPNHCEITAIKRNQKVIAYLGSRCGRWSV